MSFAVLTVLALVYVSEPGNVRVQARLGQPVRVFDVQFGDGTGDLLRKYKRCAGTQSHFAGEILIDRGRAVMVRWPGCGKLAGARESLLLAQAFMPTDAVRGKRFVDSDGWAGTFYSSRSLAKTLPVDAFKDCDGKRVPPGTLYYQYTPDNVWVIGIGACP